MRFKTINHLAPGDKVGADLFDLNGQLVLAKDVVLTDVHIKYLRDQDFAGLYINDYASFDIDIKPVIPESLRNEAQKCVKEGDMEAVIACSKKIVDDVVENGVVAMDMETIKHYDDYTFAHSVNVAVLACMLGLCMELSEKDLDNVVLTGLLHDIGKKQIPESILNKPDKLTKEEYELLKTHPTLSYDVIENRKDIPDEVKNAVLFHHENEDGSGYPIGTTGDRLSLITKIIHVVDIYDALIADRPYKKGYTPWEAAEYLMGGCGFMFDKNVVDTFIRNVPLYPKGTEIVLSTGEHAIVLENKGENNLRPKIRLLDTYEIINLADRKNITTTFYTGDEWQKRKHEEQEKERRALKGLDKKKRILVVDDMKMNRIMLKGILEANYDLEFAESGEQAIEFIKHDKKLDLIMMDIDMPGMSGLQAAAEINKTTDSRIPILFVSAIRDKGTVVLCRELHAAGYVSRPYQPGYVLTEVERIIYKSW